MRDSRTAELAGVRFIASHQHDGKLPAWLAPSMNNLKHQTRPGIWLVRIGIFTRPKLKPGEHWVERGPDQPKMVGTVDPKTGQKMIVIQGDCGQEHYPLFEIEVDLHTGACELLKDTNLASLHQSDFEIQSWPAHIPKPDYVAVD